MTSPNPDDYFGDSKGEAKPKGKRSLNPDDYFGPIEPPKPKAEKPPGLIKRGLAALANGRGVDEVDAGGGIAPVLQGGQTPSAEPQSSAIDRAQQPTSGRMLEEAMLTPEFVQSVRADFGKIPPEKRMDALREQAVGSSSKAMAARIILRDAEAENSRADMVRQQSSGMVDGLERTMAAPRVPFKTGSDAAPVASVDFPEAGAIPQYLQGRDAAGVASRHAAARAVDADQQSIDALTQREQAAASDPDAKAFAAENPMTSAVASGAAGMLRGLDNIVPTVFDFASNLVGAKTSGVKNQSETSAWLERKARNLMPEAGQQEMGAAWHKGEFGNWLMLNLAATAPQLAPTLVAAFVPGAQPAALGLLGGIAAGNKYADTGNSAAAVASGLVEGFSERLPLKYFERSAKALSTLPPAIRGKTVQAIGKALPIVGKHLTAQGVVGAIEEVVAQIGNNAIDATILEKDNSLLDGVAEAAVIGAFASGGLSIPQAAGALRQAAQSPEQHIARAIDDAAAQFGLNTKAAATLREKTAGMEPEKAASYAEKVFAAAERAGLVKKPGGGSAVRQNAKDLAAKAAKDAEAQQEVTTDAGSSGDSDPAVAAAPSDTGLADDMDAGAILGTQAEAPQATSGEASTEGATDGPMTDEPAQPGVEAGAAPPIEGEPINKAWSAFTPESGTLNIPREQMPQVDAEHRGALVQFLGARGITHESAEVPADSLKPTQAEFSPKKVEHFAGNPSGRSILVSQDGYVLDGHHQWMAKRAAGEPVKVIRLNAPIQDLLRLTHQFPSSTTSKGPRNAVSGNGAGPDGGRLAQPGPSDAGDGRGTGALVPGELQQPGAAGTAGGAVPDADAGNRPAATGPGAGNEALTALQVTFGGKTYPVESVEDAQRKWEAFRDSADGGGAAGVSQIGNGIRVVDGAGRFVARISYNGRVWDTEDGNEALSASKPKIFSVAAMVVGGKHDGKILTKDGARIHAQLNLRADDWPGMDEFDLGFVDAEGNFFTRTALGLDGYGYDMARRRGEYPQPDVERAVYTPAAAAGKARRAGALGVAPTLTAGQSVTIDGAAWTVDKVGAASVTLTDAAGGKRVVATNSKTFGQIQPEAATAPAEGPGSDAGNGFKQGPKAGERYRVGVVASVGGAVSLEKRLPAGTAATFYIGKDGNLIDGDSVNLIGDGKDRLWIPATPEQAQQAQAILDEMGRLELNDPARKDAKARLKALVQGKPTQEPNEAARPQPEAQPAEAAAPAAATAPAAPAVVPGAGTAADEAGRVKRTAVDEMLGLKAESSSDAETLKRSGFKQNASAKGIGEWRKNDPSGRTFEVLPMGGRYIASVAVTGRKTGGRDIASGDNLDDVLRKADAQFPGKFLPATSGAVEADGVDAAAQQYDWIIANRPSSIAVGLRGDSVPMAFQQRQQAQKMLDNERPALREKYRIVGIGSGAGRRFYVVPTLSKYMEKAKAAAPNAEAPAPPQPTSGEAAPAPAPEAAPQEKSADDYLAELFGTPAEQAAAQERFMAAEAQRKQDEAKATEAQRADAKRIRDAIGAEVKRAQAEHDDWSSRTYKVNKTQVELRGDGPSNQASMSIGAINESRRRNALEALTQELKALDKLGKAIATDDGAAQFMGAMRDLYARSEKIAADGNGLFKTPGEQFQYMLLDDLKVRGPGGKGNVTSNGLSKAVLAAIKPEAATPAATPPTLTPKAQAVKEALARKDKPLDDLMAKLDGPEMSARPAFTAGRRVVRVVDLKQTNSALSIVADGDGFKVVVDNDMAGGLREKIAARLAEVAAPVATHKDPGEPAEPVTPAVVREAIKTGVQDTGRKPSAMKAELLRDIDQAVQDAPDYSDFQAAVKSMGLKDATAVFTDAKGTMGEKAAPKGYSRPTRTFKVEGDGVFTVQNTVRQLLTFRAKVESSPGFRDRQAPTGLNERATDALDRRSTDAAIANMVDEGDFQAALDYAEAKGVDMANVKLTKVLRDRLDKWEQDQASAKRMAEYEAANPPAPKSEPAPAPAAEPEADDIPEAGIASQTFEQWVRAKYAGNEYKARYLDEFGGDERRAILGAAIGTIDNDRKTPDLLKAARAKYHGELLALPRETSISLDVWDALDNMAKVEAQRHFYDLDRRITRRTQDETKARVEAERVKKAPYEAAFAEVDAEIRRLDALPGPETQKQKDLSARRDRLREALYQIGQGKEPDGRLLRKEAATTPAAAPAAPAALEGPRRDPEKVSMFNPYLNGDIVTIGGKDWMLKQDMPGWYLTSDGTWRGEHPTIKGIKAMQDLIREVEQAAQEAAPPPKRAPKSFRQSHKVTTQVFMEEAGAFAEQEVDADTALTALAGDIKALTAFRNCIARD